MTFEDTLASWLPAQRWFSGKEANIRDLTITAEAILLAGDPELRHLIISLTQDGRMSRYQVLVGVRAQLPESFRQVAIGPTSDGRFAYDALHDDELTRVLLAEPGRRTGRRRAPLQSRIRPR